MQEILKGLTLIAALAFLAGCGVQGVTNTGATGASARDAAYTPYTVTGNPLFPALNTSDPAVRIFRDPGPTGTLFMYTTVDLQGADYTNSMNKSYPMNRIICLATNDLVNWKHYGPVMMEKQLGWVKPDSSGNYPNHLWASDCIHASDGKYYLYMPDWEDLNKKTVIRIGVAISDHPWGTFVSTGKYIDGLALPEGETYTGYQSGYASDPGFCSGPDGSCYMVFCTGDWPVGRLAIVKMNTADLTTVAPGETPHLIKGLPNQYMEGPSLYSMYGQYYLVYAASPTSKFTETINYSTCATPTGDYSNTEHVIMNASTICPTNQASITRWGSNWLFFYHNTVKATDSSGVTTISKRKVFAEHFRFNYDLSIPLLTQSAGGLTIGGF